VVNTGPDRSGADSRRAAGHRTDSRRAARHRADSRRAARHRADSRRAAFHGFGLYGQHCTVLGAIRDSAQGAVQ